MTHICISKLTIIGSNNGLSPDRRQAITWINDGLSLITPLGTNFSEIWSEIHTFHSRECILETVVCEMASILSRPQCVELLHVFSHLCPNFSGDLPHPHVKSAHAWSVVYACNRCSWPKVKNDIFSKSMLAKYSRWHQIYRMRQMPSFRDWSVARRIAWNQVFN